MDMINQRNLERSNRPTGTGRRSVERSAGKPGPARGRFAPVLITLALLTVAVGAASTAARTLAVPESYPTLKAALDAAGRGDIILVGCGTYHEHDLQMKPGVSLWSGTLQPDCVVIDAGGRGRIFLFTDCDSTTSVVGFTLRNGRSDADGGAILCRDSSVRLSRVHIHDSRARRGGGLASLGREGPHLLDCVISGNEADLHGGGLYWDISGSGRIERATIERNRALAGGGLACREAGQLSVMSVTFQGNAAAGSGGAVWLGGGAPRFDQCLIVGNHGGLAGGGLAIHGGRPRLEACTVADNTVETAGGGLLVEAASVQIHRTILAFNDPGALASGPSSGLRLTATNIFGHRDGDWVGPLAEQLGRERNFSLDPDFCSREDGRYDLRVGSPCLPGGSGGGLVGARSRGCGPIR